MKPHELLEIWHEGGLQAALYLGLEKNRLKVRLEDGQDIAITEGRIASRSGQAAQGPEALRRHRERAEALADQVDVAGLWEVLVDEGGEHRLEDLAELALSASDPAACGALLRAFERRRHYFARKKALFEPCSRTAVEQAIHREAAEREAAQVFERFLEAARGALEEPGRTPVPPGSEKLITALEQAAVGENLEAAKPVLRGLRPLVEGEPSLAAFQVLRALGVYREDENLFIRRFGLREAFDRQVLRAAHQAAARELEPGREDRTAELLLAIDDEGTVEVDDAVSVAGPDALGRFRVGVHISDAAHYVSRDSQLDREALQRAATYYLPERRLPMLPAEISEQAASLIEGEQRPALSFVMLLDGEANLLDFEIQESRVRVVQRLTYDQADAMLAGGELPAARALQRLKELSDQLQKRREEAGALLLKANEPRVKVGADGEIHVGVIDPNQPSRLLVSEWMVQVNTLLAQKLAAAGVPTIYRRQPPPEDESALPRGVVSDPVQIASLKRKLKRAEIGLEPGPHAGLGVPAYTQVTSPLRRYQDLAMHRQVKAWIRGEPLAYDAKALWTVAATTETAEKAARLAERGSIEYWLLKFLEGRIGAEFEAMVLSVEGFRPEVELLELALRTKIAPRSDFRPGMRLGLVVESADARAGRLELKPVRRLDPVLR
jgi:exoribonuclease-2